MPTNVRDPRTIVTPDAFRVEDGLLGMPLAPPSRRLGAMAIDLAMVGLLTVVLSSVQLLLWGVIGLALVRVGAHSSGRSMGEAAGVMLRLAVGCLGFGILAIVAVTFGVIYLADDPEGSARQAVRAGLEGIDMAGVEVAVEDGEGGLAGPLAVGADSVAGPSTAPSPEVAALRAQLQAERRSRRDLEARRDAEGSAAAAFVDLLRDVWDQLGSAIGLWSIYFTALVALWNGQTVGKRLLGVRVVRLDGTPIGWWPAFERAGGYVAGLATGLLGFAQVFWDRNRQCIHDKIVGTVVVDERAVRVPGAWREAWEQETTSAAASEP